ncbi:MAG TPA: hypothetical protein VMW31_03865 [Devosiaceae bacterium]|nr:hypothetical protein [Devosiaceae bacterium]
MARNENISDRRLSLALFLAILAAIVVAGALVFFVFGPALAAAVEPGLGLRGAALVAAGVSMSAIVMMAIAAGDGLLGELQYMILGFLGFFVVSWLMIAWIF